MKCANTFVWVLYIYIYIMYINASLAKKYNVSSLDFKSEVYINILNECLLEVANFFYTDGWILLEDNSLINLSNLSREIFQKDTGFRLVKQFSKKDPIKNL